MLRSDRRAVRHRCEHKAFLPEAPHCIGRCFGLLPIREQAVDDGAASRHHSAVCAAGEKRLLYLLQNRRRFRLLKDVAQVLAKQNQIALPHGAAYGGRVRAGGNFAARSER